MCQTYSSVTPYVTKNGSEIHELMHPTVQSNKNQSLEEATISVGAKTLRDRHFVTEELNHMIDGHGLMHLGDQTFDVFAGDNIRIIPGNEHCIENIGSVNLVLLCCCSPAYAHDDPMLVA